MTQTQQKMKDLRFCLMNDLRGVKLEEHADLEGFIIRDGATHQVLYTAYCAESGYSSYIAINDIARGIECADEKPLAEKESLFTAISRIQADHKEHSVGLYPRWREAICYQGGVYD